MALLATERTMCDKMVFDFDSLVSPIRGAKAGVKGQQGILQGMLNGHSGSAQSTLDSADQMLKDQVNAVVPGTSPEDMEAIKNMIDRCAYLSGLSPVSTMVGATDSILGKVHNFVSNIGSTVPEFDLARVMSTINDMFSSNGSGLTDLFKKLDTLLNCLEAYCGGEYPAQISDFTTTLNDLRYQLNVVDAPGQPNDATFDFIEVMNQAGTSLEDQDKIMFALDSVETAKATAYSSIDNAIASIKSFTTTAGGFIPI